MVYIDVNILGLPPPKKKKKAKPAYSHPGHFIVISQAWKESGTVRFPNRYLKFQCGAQRRKTEKKKHAFKPYSTSRLQGFTGHDGQVIKCRMSQRCLSNWVASRSSNLKNHTPMHKWTDLCIDKLTRASFGLVVSIQPKNNLKIEINGTLYTT